MEMKHYEKKNESHNSHQFISKTKKQDPNWIARDGHSLYMDTFLSSTYLSEILTKKKTNSYETLDHDVWSDTAELASETAGDFS
jgi:hypothetical protein